MPLFFESYNTPVDGNGAPYPGGKLYFYDENTTTPKDTFTTRALSVANANPVVADGSGRFAGMWLSTGRYKAVLKTAADVTIYTADGIEGSDAVFSVMTTRGDLITRSATTAVRLPLGTNGQLLSSDGTDPVWTTGLSLSVAQTWTAAQTFQLTDDGAGVGPTFTLRRVSASPAANDTLGQLVFEGKDSAGNNTQYAGINSEIVDPTDTSEDGRGYLFSAVAGTVTARWFWGNGFYASTLADMGAGTVNAMNYYKNGAALPFSQTSLVNAGVMALGGALTVAHALGTKPLVVFLYVKCLTAEHGYSIGDEVVMQMGAGASANNRTFSIVLDATNVNIRVGTDTVSVLNKTTGVFASLTLASWDLYVRSIA